MWKKCYKSFHNRVKCGKQWIILVFHKRLFKEKQQKPSK